MRRQSFGLVLACLVVGGIPAAAAARVPLTITLTSAPGPLVRYAHPPSGDVGDQLSSSLVLMATTSAHSRMGSMRYSFTMIAQGIARIDTTTTLAGGTILATGAKVSLAQPALTVTITGGTGRYAGARGTLTFGPMTTQRNVYRLTLPTSSS